MVNNLYNRKKKIKNILNPSFLFFNIVVVNYIFLVLGK